MQQPLQHPRLGYCSTWYLVSGVITQYKLRTAVAVKSVGLLYLRTDIALHLEGPARWEIPRRKT